MTQKAAIVTLLCCCSAFCGPQKVPSQDELTRSLSEAYAKLGAQWEFGTVDADGLAECADTKDMNCLWTFKVQRSAVERIFDMGRESALRRTLSAIHQFCAAQQPKQAHKRIDPWARCSGATQAIFFFHRPQEDAAIRAAFGKFSPDVIKNVFRQGEWIQWLQNRPEKQPWRELIDSWEFLDKNANDASVTTQSLRSEIDMAPAKVDSADLLLDPEFQLDPKLAARIDDVLKSSKIWPKIMRDLNSFAPNP